MTRLFLAPILIASMFTASANASDARRIPDRFGLWHNCEKMLLFVNSDIGGFLHFPNEIIETIIKQKLRAVRLYRRQGNISPTLSVHLNAWSTVRGRHGRIVYFVNWQLKKAATDEETGISGLLPTFSTMLSGMTTNINDVKSSIANYTDEFIDEYFRVNEDACDPNRSPN